MAGYAPKCALRLLPSCYIRGADFCRREQALVRRLACQLRFPVVQEGSYSLVPVPAEGRIVTADQGCAGFAVDLCPALNDGAVEGAKARALDDTADADEGEDERHEGEVGHLYRAGVRLRSALVVTAPSLPVLPGGVVARVGVPALAVKLPLVGR
jgi:hypothetical protein